MSMKNKFLHLIFSRLVITGILILIQVLFLIGFLLRISDYFIYAQALFFIFSILMVIYIINRNSNPTFKLPWVILIILFPIFGGILYWMFGKNHIQKRVQKFYRETKKLTKEDPEIRKKLKQENSLAASQSHYLYQYAHAPLYGHTETKYYPIGEVFYEDLLDALRSAKKFIFLEYFIIDFGVMWSSILDVLKEKVKEGIEVRVMYDDIGCVALLPKRYYKELESLGIKCVPFNRFIPIVSVIHNNRDHRKIAIIDGNIGFTGGINLADEYINQKEKYGHWKDTALRLRGEGVWNLTVLFLESWNKFRKTDTNCDKYRPTLFFKNADVGYVQPYGDTPLDEELVGQNVYLNLIEQAKSYIYINTPYLILDYEMLSALALAAKRGVDVRIVTPHIPDKWYIHIISQSYYETLIRSGIKIYEYQPGFLHAKSFLVDDELGTVGSINLDYRSLIHHYECGVWMYRTEALKAMKQDYLETLEKCIFVDRHFCSQIPWYKRWCKDFLQLFAPLL